MEEVESAAAPHPAGAGGDVLSQCDRVETPVYPCYSGTREKIAKIKNIWAIFPLLPAGDPAPPWRGQGLSTVIKGFIQSLEIQIYTLTHVPIGL